MIIIFKKRTDWCVEIFKIILCKLMCKQLNRPQLWYFTIILLYAIIIWELTLGLAQILNKVGLISIGGYSIDYIILYPIALDSVVSSNIESLLCEPRSYHIVSCESLKLVLHPLLGHSPTFWCNSSPNHQMAPCSS